ncbi:hypothetical protein CR513_59997, partial [Mucuna pruriens]
MVPQKRKLLKEENKDFIIVHIYVDDIIFGATNECLCKNFSDLMQSKFKMSMMGELKFFLRLQFKQEDKGIIGSLLYLTTSKPDIVFFVCLCAKAEYVKYQLKDYSNFEHNIPILCDNTSVINLSKNPIQHSKAKHIKMRHNFIRDYVQKDVFDIKFIDINHQWDDICTFI